MLTVGQRIELRLVLAAELGDAVEPVVQQAELVLLERGLHAAAAIVAAHDDMAHMQPVDRVLQRGEAVEVGHLQLVADAAMVVDLARHEADAFVARHAAVGAADPQHARRMMRGHALEEVRIVAVDAGLPGAVVGHDACEDIVVSHVCPSAPGSSHPSTALRWPSAASGSDPDCPSAGRDCRRWPATSRPRWPCTTAGRARSFPPAACRNESTRSRDG